MMLDATEPRGGGTRRIAIDRSQRLGAGGEGEVFADRNSDLVYKIFYNPTQYQHDKIQAMLASPPQHCLFQKSGDSRDHPQIAWPMEILREPGGGSFKGYSMPRVSSGTVSLDRLFSIYDIRRYKLQDANTLHTRLYIGRNLSSIVSYIHDAGHVVIDIKPQNIQLYKKGGFCCLLDCDGFTVVRGDGRRFPARVITPEFLAPEHFVSNTGQMGREQDHYGIAVILYRLLNNNLHPTDGVPLDSVVPSDYALKARNRHFAIDPNGLIGPHQRSVFDYLDDDTQKLFHRAFLATPHDRPTAAEWRDHLDALVSRVQRCASNPLHDHFSKGCGYCALNQPSRPRAPSPSATTQSVHSSPSGGHSPASSGFAGIFPTWSTPPPAGLAPAPAGTATKAAGQPPSPGAARSSFQASLFRLGWLPWKLRGSLRKRRLVVIGLLAIAFGAAVQVHKWGQNLLWCAVFGDCGTQTATERGTGGSGTTVFAPVQRPIEKPPSPILVPAPSEPGTREQQYFEKVERDDVCPGFRAYLQSYPDGFYRERAASRLQELDCP